MMKLTLSNIKELKRKSDSPLTKRVCNYVIDRWGDYDDKKEYFLKKEKRPPPQKFVRRRAMFCMKTFGKALPRLRAPRGGVYRYKEKPRDSNMRVDDYFFFFVKVCRIFLSACSTPPSSLDGTVLPMSFLRSAKAFSVT